MLNHLNVILAGFSIISISMLLLIYLFSLPNMSKTWTGKLFCTLTLVSLALIQGEHFLFFINNINLLDSRFYCGLLFIIPPAFFFFGREILFTNIHYQWRDMLHMLPIILSLFFPTHVLPSLAFLLGTGYTFWFTRSIYKLRHESRRFKFEMFFFGLFAIIALAALLLGLSLPFIDDSVFHVSYSNAISIAILLIVTALLVFPELLSDILLIAELAYTKTKLHDIDVEQKKSALEQLMLDDRLYENEDLNLSMVAAVLDVSSHQLSELINTEYNFSFPRFVREHRVTAAKALLKADKQTSILAISMMTGFKSQSSFYTAFKEATGQSPGRYRNEKNL